jgi:indolepyruvate ferredoxin oxidoreductase alpha subunit
MGYQFIQIVDPQDLKAMDEAVVKAAASEVPAAIVVRRPCLLIKGIKHDIGKCVVDTDKCIGCKSCLRVGCPAILVENKKAKIDQNQCVGCTVCAQVCPKGAITRKE